MNKKMTIVAPVGDYMEDIFVGIRNFPTEKVILIAPKDRVKEAEETRKSLEKFKVPVKIIEIEGFIWEEIFKTVSQIRKSEGEDILINVSTGDRESRCAATSAAFVNGLKAFGIKDDEPMMLPVLKFSYYTLLTEKKMEILKTLYSKKECCASLDELSQKTKMSLPLVSYHINGTMKSEGLKQMGLIETEETKGKVKVNLTFLGRMLVKGYVQ
jgi:DNA-binding transcriptional ArsR family regulator